MISSSAMVTTATSFSKIDKDELVVNNPKSNCNNKELVNLLTDITHQPTGSSRPDLTAVHTSAATTTPHTCANRITSTLTAAAPATTTKIPHPLKTPWPHRTNQFQRSASLRLRVSKSKSDFHFSTINDNLRVNEMETKPLETGIAEGENYEEGIHEISTIGCFSPRRKLVLISQSSDTNADLARSLSLRKDYKVPISPKTESLKQPYQTCPGTEAGSSIKAAVSSESLKVLQANNNKERDSPDGVSLTGVGRENVVIDASREIINKTVEITTPLLSKDNSKMSLNLSAVPLTTNVRPTTLENVINTATATATATSTATTASTSTSTSTSTSKTDNKPKTPGTPTTAGNTPVTAAVQQPHQHHRHIHCPKHAALPTVPESKLTPKTPPVTPDSPSTFLEDDMNSLYSYATTTSGRSTMSCEHPYVARNGTTFSGRKMKYVVHCSNYAGQVGADYLTPTQRAQRQIRRLKELLCAARQDLEQKDSEILRLTREVVELRLFKASLSPPEERSASSDAVTVREAELKTSQDVSPIVDMVDDGPKTTSSPRHHGHHHGHHHQHQHQQHQHRHHKHQQQKQPHVQQSQPQVMQLSSEMLSSYADSGHFEDMTSSSIHSKDSYIVHTCDRSCGSEEAIGGTAAADVAAPITAPDGNQMSSITVEQYEIQRQQLIRLYEQRIEELIRTQDSATSEIKRTNNDRIEALLQKLAECNTRYADIVPNYEHAKERIRELEKQLEDLQRKLAEHEEKQNKMYLHMYQKGQEAERIARADQALELAHRAPHSKVSINELLHQLQSTQDELENIRAAECRNECGSNHALLTAKEAISLWVLGARKTIYRRLLEAQKNRSHVDPEVTLQFLKSAVYYFLTDKENSQGHLQAIESILEFTEAEKRNISKAYFPK